MTCTEQLSYSKGLFTIYVSGQRWDGGVSKMLTMADKGGRGSQANADIDCQRSKGGLGKC